jgi:hypothetical protein
VRLLEWEPVSRGAGERYRRLSEGELERFEEVEEV